MKILMINGSPNEFGCTYTALKEVSDTLNNQGIETEFVYLGKKAISGCIACGKCKEIKKCIIDDQVNQLLDRCDEFDGMVVGSPVYYAGPSGQLCAFLDRFFYASRGRLRGKVASAVVSCRRGGASAAFDRLNKYFTINCMTVASSQYWNQVHGYTPEDVRKDEEGLQTMRTLGLNIAYLLESQKAAMETGIQKPKYEKKIYTDFIR